MLVIWSEAPKSMTRVVSGKTRSGSTLLSQHTCRARPNRIRMHRHEVIVLFIMDRDYSRYWWKWLWSQFFNLKTSLVSRGFTIQLPTEVYHMILTMTISELTKAMSSTTTPLFMTSTTLAPTTTSTTPHRSGKSRFITRSILISTRGRECIP